MAQIANKKMAGEQFIKARSIWDIVPAIITNSWGQSWSRAKFSTGLDLSHLNPEYFISVQIASFDLAFIASGVAASSFAKMTVCRSQRITYNDQNC